MKYKVYHRKHETDSWGAAVFETNDMDRAYGRAQFFQNIEGLQASVVEPDGIRYDADGIHKIED